MKRIFTPIFLIIALSIMLFGCTPNNNIDGDGYINEDGDIVGDNRNNITEDGDIVAGNNDGYITEEGDIVGDNSNDNMTEDGDVTGEGDKDDSSQDQTGGYTEEDNTPDTGDDDNQENLPAVGTKVGNKVADITLTTMDGGTISLSDLRGKIVILNFWASWCPPCKAELPDFDEVATEYKDEVVIIAADVDGGMGGADAYVQQNFPDSDIVFAYDTINGTAYYTVDGNGYVPYTVIIDQNGVITYTDSGMLSHAWLVNMIDSLTK